MPQDTRGCGDLLERRSEKTSPLGDLPLFVREVLSAGRAILLHLQLFGHGPLVLGSRVIGSPTLGTSHFDEVSHDGLRKGGSDPTTLVRIVKQPLNAIVTSMALT